MKCPDCGTEIALNKSLGKQSGGEHECPECGSKIDKTGNRRRLMKA